MTAFPADDIERKAQAGDTTAQLELATRLEAEKSFLKARQWLWRAATAGNTEAKAALALRLVAFPSFAVIEGLKWANAAASEGSAAAAHLLALMTGEGLGVPQNWTVSLDGCSARPNSGASRRKQAQAELSALAGQWELAHAFRENRDAHEDFARLRQSIDLSSWLSVPQARLVSESPRIGMVENFLRRDACDWLIARNRPHLARAQIYDTETGSLTDQGERTNTAAGLDFSRAGIVLIIARARMAAIAGLSVEGFEDSVLLHYDVGEEFSPHYDFFDPSVAGHAPELQAGQRVLTFLTYLNEGFEGSETGFPEIDRRYKGAKGEGLFFWNAALDGTPDPRTLHAGLPVATGEKWLLSQWIRHRTGL